MRGVLLCLLGLLTACGGGGGGSSAPPFTPSADIAATHPWLSGRWEGDYRSSSTGLLDPLQLEFWTTPSPTGVGSEAYCQSLWTLADDYRAIVQADGRRIVVVAANYSHDSQNTVDLRASQDGRSMTGTYVVRKIETGEVRDRGTLSLRKDGGQFPVWLGVCNAPGWAIVVREER